MDPQALQMPRRFGRYVLLDRMGVGGMAEVFRAVMPGAGGFRSDVVIKRILAAQALAPNFVEMFGHEARISALLHHPNIVQVFDFGYADGGYFLVMELLRGHDLSAIMRALRERQRPFPIAIAAHIAHQVARGLGHAHTLTDSDGQALDIIHHDVSPSNIMCLRAGGVKLLDFGIASALGEMESAESEASGFKGKVGYSAPERLRNQPQDGRVDQFALGVVLWEMLAGRRLFRGKAQDDKLKAILSDPIAPPSSLRVDVPAALDRIVMKALERDPQQRYPLGQSMADDLEQAALEANFASRMLPKLLHELFGSAPSAAHTTLASIPAEMLINETSRLGPQVHGVPKGASASIATPGSLPTADPAAISSTRVSTGPAGEIVPGAIAVRIRAIRTRTKVLALGGIVTTLAGLGLATVIAAARPNRNRRSTDTAVLRAGAPRPPSHIYTPPIADAVPASSVDETTAPDRATEPVAVATSAANRNRPRTVQREIPSKFRAARVSTIPSPHAARGISDGRVASGLSIDPFAEAAARSTKR